MSCSAWSKVRGPAKKSNTPDAMRQLSGRRDDAAGRGEPLRTAGVYVHFPYCLAKCPYCDFVSYAERRERIDHVGYADAVLNELGVRAGAAAANSEALTIASVFLGGGTPSLWDPTQIGRVLQGVRNTFACTSDLE